MSKINWEKRARRARDLGDGASSQVLSFYQHVLEVQQQVYEDVVSQPSLAPPPDSSFFEQLDIKSAAQSFLLLLEVTERRGPAKLAEEARRLRTAGSAEHRELLSKVVQDHGVEGHDTEAFFARILLQPCAEFLAARLTAVPGFTGSNCPICGSKPQLAVLRPEGDGGKRYLACSFCLSEWEFRRILCPVCREMEHTKLPRYSADDLAAVRVEACDTCKHYLKSFDMTVNGLLVPEVDEIATVALDLWAAKQGYGKIQLNLMGF